MRLCGSPCQWVGIGFLMVTHTILAMEETTADVHQRLTAVFTQADTSEDRRLSLDEFLAGRDNVPVAKRDFRMCDFNDDQHLSLDEFLTVPLVVEAKHRGPVPDIISGLVDQMVAALDAACDNWDKQPQLELNADRTYQALSGQLQRWNGGDLQIGMDFDNNGTVSRAEARRCIEICMGIQTLDGVLLRYPNGQVVNQPPFLEADINRDNRLNGDEFAAASRNATTAVEGFATADQNHDGFVSLDEWVGMKNRVLFDPVEEFRRMDSNLDALLDREELLKGTPQSQQELAKRVFPTFDWNRDGVLTLAEYRTTMQANRIMDWSQPLYASREEPEKLIFWEFYRDHRVIIPFLRAMYFHRLDANGNKTLDADECSFRPREPDTFFVMNEDGTGWKQHYRFEEYKVLAGPTVSPDGKTIAFEVGAITRAIRNEPLIFRMPFHGGKPKALITGRSPSWSPDGKSLVYTRHGGASVNGLGIWQLDQIEGDFQTRFLVANNWEAGWSPDGKQIAMTTAGVLNIYDTTEKTVVDVLAPVSGPYREILSNIVWSPEGKRLCFVGFTTTGFAEVAVLDVSGAMPKLTSRHILKSSFFVWCAWHPSKDRVIFSTYCNERKFTQLYEFNPTTDDPPKLMPGQDPARNNTDACWTPDGKRLIVISGDY